MWVVSPSFPHQNRLGSAAPHPTPPSSFLETEETHLIELCGNYTIIKYGSLLKGFSYAPVLGGTAITVLGLERKSFTLLHFGS